MSVTETSRCQPGPDLSPATAPSRCALVRSRCAAQSWCGEAWTGPGYALLRAYCLQGRFAPCPRAT